MSLGPIVKQLREALDMTQEELANKAGVDRSYIGHIERGDRDAGPEVIRGIAKALRVEPSVLFDAALGLRPAEEINLEDPELRLMFEWMGGLGQQDRARIMAIIRDVQRLYDERGIG